jgi:hypothetical protein
LKKLDDLPTLAQLKELEELRVQLSLPGAEPVVESPQPDTTQELAGESPEAAAEEDDLEAAAATEPRPQGLVARGADDDAG